MLTLLKNAHIYTSDINKPWATMMAFDGDSLTYIGDDDFIPEKEGNFTAYDMNGKLILPGIVDSHIHPGMCSKSAWHIRLPWTNDMDELLGFIKNFADNHPKEEMPFLYFEYYPTSMFDENGPKKEWLDDAVSDRPCLCQDFGEHLCWVNSKMLELMGMDKNTKDPSVLESFVRDENGEPTGWVRELAWLHFADKMFQNINWYPPENLSVKNMEKFFEFLKDSGITAIFDGFIESDEQIKSIYEMDLAGKLKTYYDGSVRFRRLSDLPKQIAKAKEYDNLYGSEHIKINTMKLFLDGTNESGNSASLHEHINDPGNFGSIMMEKGELADCFTLCNQEGMDLHIHVVGDRGFRIACDAVEIAQKRADKENIRWVCQPVFAHCEVVDPEDMKRPAELGIIINWSCHWSGGYFGEDAMKYYTEEKWRRMYRFNEMIDNGTSVSFSSDVVTFYELHRAHPFFGMQVAATRIDPEFPLDSSKYPASMRPEESAKININALIKGYTLTGAKQLRWDNLFGSLEVGKKANFIIVDKNIFEIAEDELKDVSIEVVAFDGEIIRGTL